MKYSQIWKFIYWPTVWALALYPWHPLQPADKMPGTFMTVAGVVLILYGLAVHIVAGKTLKALGHTSGNNSIWPDRLVIKGIYSAMRHPQHLGLTLIPMGIGCLIGSFQAVLAAGWTVAAAFFFVLAVEEPECIRKFGQDYFHYMEQTPPFSLRPSALIQGIKFIKGL